MIYKIRQEQKDRMAKLSSSSSTSSSNDDETIVDLQNSLKMLSNLLKLYQNLGHLQLLLVLLKVMKS